MKVYEAKHPLIKHKISLLRDKNTGTKEFRELITEIATYLCYEATKTAKLYKASVETPLTRTTCYKLDENKYAFLPILRAGMSMIDGILTVIPNAKIGHIGLYRNEKTLKPVEYYYKVPKDIDKREVFILDPMLATGGSSIATIERLKKDNVKKIKLLCIIAAPEGIKAIKDAHEDIEIYCASIDEKLNDVGYILPGLGDAGDRVYGTK